MQSHSQFAAVEALFRQGLEVPVAEREVWFDNLLEQTPPAVVHEVRKLLRADADANSVTERLNRPVVEQLPSVLKPLRVGECVGNYQLVEEIGVGGMGVVWRAYQDSLEREVALKLVRPDVLLFQGALDRFRAEARAIASLQHPAIVEVYEAGEANGVAFLAMQYVRGKTLADWLREVRSESERRLDGADLHRSVAGGAATAGGMPSLFDGPWQEVAMRIIGRVAHALEAAHGRGIIHRDAKPSNIMVDGDGRVLLLDFGIARNVDGDSLTASFDAIGSLPYMAPEQIVGEDVDVRADVHCLGVTLYELLAGSLPYDPDGSREALRRQRLETGLPALREVCPDASWEVETICRKATERLPQDRYATMRELRLDLDRALARQPIVARRPGWTLRARRWVQRSPLQAGVIGLLFLSLLLAGVLVAVLPVLAASYERATQARLEEGFHLFSEARYAASRVAFAEVLQREPEHVEAHASVALTHVLEGDEETALHAITQLPLAVRNQEPVVAVREIALRGLDQSTARGGRGPDGFEDPFAHYLQARALRSAVERRDRDAIHAARRHLLRAIYGAPVPRRIYHFEMARVVGRVPDSREATAVADAMLRLWGREDWLVWYFVAYANRRTDLVRCVHAYERCLELSPGRWFCHANVSSALQELRRDEDALAHAQMASELRPERVSLLHFIGATLMRLQRFDDAETHLREALARHPSDRRLRLYLIEALRGRSDHAAAVAQAETLLGEDGSARVRAVLATVLLAAGRIEAGRAQHELAAAEARDDAFVQANQVLLHCLAGKDRAAQELCGQLAARKDSHEGLRRILLSPWRADLGIRDEQALPLLRRLARGDVRANMRGYALQAYEEALRLAPADEGLASEYRKLVERRW